MPQPELQSRSAAVPQPPVIRGGQVVADDWLAVTDTAALTDAPIDAAVLVPLALWHEHRDVLLERRAAGARLGVQLAPDDDPAGLATDLATNLTRIALIAVEFPQFTDGRGYSTARLLRERHGYRGELRAVGDVQRDQLFYMVRCGFDAFVLRADKDPVKALSAYHDFSEAYQAAVDQPVPLFRRRDEVLARIAATAAARPAGAAV